MSRDPLVAWLLGHLYLLGWGLWFGLILMTIVIIAAEVRAHLRYKSNRWL